VGFWGVGKRRKMKGEGRRVRGDKEKRRKEMK
jgi:hypothetical protein